MDVKGARLWRGAKTATENGMKNVAFLRTRIEFIDSCFAPGEVDEIWITFPDPQLNKNRIKKRLTAPQFLAMYARFLQMCIRDSPSAVRTDGTGKKDGNIVYNGMKDDYAEYTVRSGKYTFTVE